MPRGSRSSKRPIGYIYFVLCPTTQRVKIGWSSSHPDKRLAAFRLGSGAPLERFGYIRDDETLERRLHAKFKHLRSHGEWYDLDEELREFIETRTQLWEMRSRSCEDDKEQFKTSRENYDEILGRLAMEWTQTHCEGYARTLPDEPLDFFEFCRRKNFRLRRSDRAVVKYVGGKPRLVYVDP